MSNGALKIRTSTSPDVWTVMGGGSFATEAETIAGVLDDRAVTPAGLKAATPYVDAREFGAVGDGTADDTAALQAWANYITSNHKVGWLPNGTYKITAPIVFPTVTGWSVIGEDRSHTIVKQFTDNVAVFQFGTVLGSQIFHSIVFRQVRLTYNTPQPAANTNAIALRLYTMLFYSELTMLQFDGCAWGIKATGESSEFGPWGNTWDDFIFTAFSIGAFDISASSSANPNNSFGRMTVTCGNAIGPVFKYRGHNASFQALEFLGANNAVVFQLLTGQIVIGAIKLEIGTYTTAGTIFDFWGGTQVQIGSIDVAGTTAAFNPASGQFYAVTVGSGGGGNGFCEIGHLRLRATSITGEVAAISCNAASRVIIGDIDMFNGWTLQSNTTTTSSNTIRVLAWANDHVSDNNGDANKTIVAATREPTTQLFTTALTAPRTFTLPTGSYANGNNLFAGLTYKIVCNGAINGANTLTIKEGATTLRTQTVDKVVIEYTWKRMGGTLSTWVMTGYQLLP